MTAQCRIRNSSAEYEVRVYHERHDRRLVTAIELVNSGNRDRPENRSALVAQVAVLLQDDACASRVDLVTEW